MKSGLILAISLSVILVGAAGWSRFASGKEAQTGLIAVNSYNPEEYYPAYIGDFLPSNSTTTSPSELTDTQAITIGFLSNYLSLAASGQTDTETISKLIEQYINNIPELEQARTIVLSEIHSVPDTQANKQAYSNNIDKIYAQYNTVLDQTGGQTGDEYNGPAFQTDVERLINVYETMAAEMIKLPAPISIAQLHLDLINTYFSSIVALKAMMQTETDSIKFIAGIAMFKGNIDLEQNLFLKIKQILTSSGV